MLRTTSSRRAQAPSAHGALGAAVQVRRVRPDDAPLIDAFVQSLSSASRQRRFHAAIRALPAPWLERMTRPDAQRELALLATVTIDGVERCVGEARYVLDGEAAFGREFALAVADDWQGRGIGRALLLGIGRHAARRGVGMLFGDVQRDNLPMIELARRLGYRVRSHSEDARLLRVERLMHETTPLRSTRRRAAAVGDAIGRAHASARHDFN